MSFYGKMLGSLAAIAIVGGSAAYMAGEGKEVLADVKESLNENVVCYVLREYDGSVALFVEGEDEPAAVFSTPISQINAADAYLLSDGIRLRGLNEVNRLLEDLEIE